MIQAYCLKDTSVYMALCCQLVWGGPLESGSRLSIVDTGSQLTIDSLQSENFHCNSVKDGDTLYRAKSDKPTRDQINTKLKKPHLEDKKPAPVHVSSLPVTTPRPGSTYSSPLYPNTPFYSTPQPPLPPGYELIPVDQLTDDHEVVPWEDLPSLMRKHNMSLNRVPLGRDN